MDTSKIIKGVVNSGRYTVTAPIVKEDYGLYLQIEGVELPSTYQVDFSNDEHHGTSVTMIGNADGVLIPHQFIDTGKDIFAFLYHVGANYGRTVYKFRIPNKVRPDRTNEQPTPEEQSVIDQAISALNTAVAQTAQDKADADVSAQNASADAERAEEARTDAQNYATQAEQARDDAQTYANNASASATASAQSASQSAQIKADVEDLVDDAQASADASERSASNAYTYATSAERSSINASASAQSASQYASQAQSSAQTASTKAQDASGYAQTASQKATESAQSATNASQSAQTALQAKTDAQTAQGLAESARDSAIQAKDDAESVAESIPSDYSQLSEDVTDLKEDLSAVNGEVFNESSVALTFFHGAIRPSNGANNNSDTRIRTASADSGYDPISGIFTAEDGVKYSIRFYAQSNGSYVGGDDIFRTGSTDVEAVAEASYPTAKYVRFVIAYSDDRNVSSDEAMAELGAKVTYKKTVGKVTALESDVIDLKENTVRKFSVAPTNSLLGNISIRAAKTINFSDGTPPHIDWYLIHDLDYNFYRTKDFVSKEFLFHITPPIGGVANWSCGIDGNNNVFFLRDAASYAASEGPDLDDAKRTNPVYFLASEGYSTMHTLDFGTGLKPAGWLGNVGWCVLPNNDIILCEYTRGALGTCNVWHVDGTDTTDPSNWSAVWSHAIIDSMDPADPGMKHCHDVQYDFYTGICYFGTGDSDDGSLIYYSTDNGLTWTLAWGPDRTKCRQLNFVFTEDKVYWASDSYQSTYHNFFVAERDANGVIDGANATAISLGQVNSQSCYGCSYLKQLGLVVMMDRNDLNNYSKIDLQGYDIASNTIVNLGTIKEAVNGGYSGFRTKFVDWYPTQNFITVGFNSTAGAVNPDSNALAVCGNLGGSTGNGSTRINNLVMYVYKIGTGYALRFDTHYC